MRAHVCMYVCRRLHESMSAEVRVACAATTTHLHHSADSVHVLLPQCQCNCCVERATHKLSVELQRLHSKQGEKAAVGARTMSLRHQKSTCPISFIWSLKACTFTCTSLPRNTCARVLL